MARAKAGMNAPLTPKCKCNVSNQADVLELEVFLYCCNKQKPNLDMQPEECRDKCGVGGRGKTRLAGVP